MENEDFFIRMAKGCGLVTNDAVLVRDRDLKSGLLVQRFDRILGKEPTSVPEWLKVHQEDACQFLNRYPADKYRIKTSEFAEGMGEFCSAPIIEVAKLIQLTAFSYLICNGDLQAKNISIRVSPKTGRIGLTPAYDLLSALPYGETRGWRFSSRDATKRSRQVNLRSAGFRRRIYWRSNFDSGAIRISSNAGSFFQTIASKKASGSQLNFSKFS